MSFKRISLLLLCLLLLVCSAGAEAVRESNGMDWQENDPWPFAILHGDRNIPQIAITMDDCFEFEWVEKSWKLISSYGGRMTIYPVGELLKEDVLLPGDREMWQSIAASDSEIGTHTHHHLHMADQNAYNMILYSKYPQYITDLLLGYHYPLRTLRPPYGSYNALYQTMLKQAGYDHIIMWDIADLDPVNILKQVKNGSILLFHARHADYMCLEAILPELVERGYEMVTISEMLGLPPLEPQEGLFDWAQYKKTHLM